MIKISRLSKDTGAFSRAGARWPAWLTLAFVLLVATFGLRHYAALFGHDALLIRMPIPAFVVLFCLVSFICIFALPKMIRNTFAPATKPVLIFIVLTGLLMRLVLQGTPAVMEDDYNRYLWDGAVTAAGENPYTFSPDQIAENSHPGDIFQTLQKQSGKIFERINHPQLGTVYPPVAQAAFSLAYWISPFSLGAWRLNLMALELGSLGLIIAILKQMGKSPLWLSIYWWNPIVLKEISNSAHMETLLTLPLQAALYFVLRKKLILSTGMLALAAGVKVWPAILVVAIWRQVLKKPKTLISSISVFIFLLSIMMWPILAAKLSQSSGFIAFGSQWQSSSAIYLLSEWLAYLFVPGWAVECIQIPLVARAILACVLLTITTVICYRPAADEQEIVRRFFLISVAVYLLAPSQTPWYFIWILPFLCIYPARGLLLVSALIPLHYTYFYLTARDLDDFYHRGIVWVIWLPVWA